MTLERKLYAALPEEVIAQQEQYKNNYSTFRPFSLTSEQKSRLGDNFYTVFSTQNGSDCDDYPLLENGKVYTALNNFPVGSKILLLGVGTGRETLAAMSLGIEAVGTTFGSRNIDFGINVLGLKEDQHLECANELLPFPNETFDAVIGFQIFEHTMAPLLFLLEQSRVLKIGGKLFLEWPPPDNYTYDDNPHHQVCYVPGQAHGLFRKAGFQNIKVYYDNLSEIPKEKWWSGEHDKMLCIEGRKSVPNKDYIINYNNR